MQEEKGHSQVCHLLTLSERIELTLFQARSGITLPGQTGQILPTYTFNHINQLNDFVVPKTYSLINVLTFRWP